jgi:transglutaminase-like putative cysteine protease
MIIQAGYKITFQCPARTPMLLQLNVHPSREGDLRSPDVIKSDPPVEMSAYSDHYDNRVTRLEAPAGLITFENRFEINDPGQLDEIPPSHELTPIPKLPDEVLLYLVSSRYCDSDALANFAWSKFGYITGGYARVQAICDYVHQHIRFSYPEASPTRSASDAMRERVGVCRDFAHLSIALCRAMNVPARYCTGYLGDIGVPIDPNPMDFSAWFEVFLGDRWYTSDARHNTRRIGRIVMARGRDAGDVPITMCFGPSSLLRFDVVTDEVVDPAAAVAAA